MVALRGAQGFLGALRGLLGALRGTWSAPEALMRQPALGFSARSSEHPRACEPGRPGHLLGLSCTQRLVWPYLIRLIWPYP